MSVAAVFQTRGELKLAVILATAAGLGLLARPLLSSLVGGSETVSEAGEGAPTPWKAQQVGKKQDDGQIGFRIDRLSIRAIKQRARDFFNLMHMRRSVRMYSSDPVPIEVINDIIAAAGTAPSGAHCQPWHFAVVKSADKKQKLREIVEAEEKINYSKRMRADWVAECEPLVAALPAVYAKPYLTEAPYIIIIMKKQHDVGAEGERVQVRYPLESVGIASGMLISAIHNANLATLSSTPMNSDPKIRALLDRPDNERVFLLLPVGFPAKNGKIPFRDEAERRKPLSTIMSVH